MRQLIMWAGLLTVSTVPNIAQHAPESKYAHDPRLPRLQQFLKHTQSPLVRLSEDFLRAADRYQLDWRLLPSIAVIETGAGKTAEKNNIFGWDSGRKAYASVREAIYHVASRLDRSALYQGKSLDALLKTYNPLPEYPGKVKAVMLQVSASEPLKARTEVQASVIPSGGLQRIARLEPAR